jgi:hypothetical protein
MYLSKSNLPSEILDQKDNNTSGTIDSDDDS